MGGKSITISCEDCLLRRSDACAECVVTYLLDHGPDDSIVFGPGEIRAMRLFQDVGLVPELRHERRAG